MEEGLETRVGAVQVVADEGRLERRRGRIIYVESIPEAGPDLSPQGFQGFFIKAEVGEEGLRVWRDHAGPIPLLYTRVGDALAIAQSRHSLPGAARHLEPGHLLEVSGEGVHERPWYSPGQAGYGDPVEALAQALSDASSLIPPRPAISFSGGLDSSLLALMALRRGLRPLCVVVGVEGSPDMERAGEAAGILGVELLRVGVDEERVKRLLEPLSRYLPSRSAMDLSLAVIFHLSALEAGRRFLVVGQGADELFGGYMKYVRALARGGLVEAGRVMWEDVRGLHLGLERDELAVSLAHASLITPYLHRRVYELGLTLPPGLKLRDVGGEVVRKYVLRLAAERLGLPRELAWRQKKAAQYGSRVERLVERVLNR